MLRGGKWESLGEAKLDPDAWVATFRIAKWDEKSATPYKLIYREQHRDGSATPHEWTGTIKANPDGSSAADGGADLPERLCVSL